jgi:3-oxoacyl-[acyl-carrier-protein] synthase-3
MIMKGELPMHQLNLNDKVLFASVGAGMNINCLAYQM